MNDNLFVNKLKRQQLLLKLTILISPVAQVYAMGSSVKQRGFTATHGNRKRTPFLLICHNASKFSLLSACL